MVNRSIIALFLFTVPFSFAGADRRDDGELRIRTATTEERRTSRDYRTDEIIVKIKGDERFTRVRNVNSEPIDALIARHRARAEVEYAEPNYIAHAFAVPNDPYYRYQWNFDNAASGGVRAATAWDTTSGVGITVAVIDTGVAYEDYTDASERYYRAPDLSATNFVQGYDFVNSDNHANDDNGHGTHVAGTVAQSTNNNMGVAGLAYGAKIMPIKVLDGGGSGTYADIAEGIRYAADNGAQVINLSLGGSSGATYLEEALRYAYEKGVTIVAAAGNDGRSSVSYPARYDNYVIAVGATRFDRARTKYSNYGSSLDIVAPGGDTSVDQNRDGYADGILQQTFSGATNNFAYYFYQGTSMAAPHVAAAAAMVISAGKASTPQEVRLALETSAYDLGSAGKDTTYGYGLLDVAAAVEATSDVPEEEIPDVPEPGPGEQIIFSDSFETGLAQWTQDGQNDWDKSASRELDGSYSLHIDGSASNAAIWSQLIDTDAAVAISYSWNIDRSFDTGEYIAFDVSTNGGQTWTEYGRLRGNVDVEEIWHDRTFTIASSTSLKLRFRGNVSSAVEDAFIDTVRVTAQ